jgi:WD40 repeat protein
VTALTSNPVRLEISTSNSNEVTQIWTISEGGLVDPRVLPTAVPGPESAPFQSLIFDQEGTRLAAAGPGGGTVWDVGSAELVLQGASLMRDTMIFGPDGDNLASGTETGWVYLWEIGQERSPVVRLGTLGDAIAGLAWPDANTLIAVKTDGTLVSLELDPEVWTTRACHAAARVAFTVEEAENYLGEDASRVCEQAPDLASPAADAGV